MKYCFPLTSCNPEVTETQGTNPFTRRPMTIRRDAGMSADENQAVADVVRKYNGRYVEIDGREVCEMQLENGVTVWLKGFDSERPTSILLAEFDIISREVTDILFELVTAGNMAISPSALPEIRIVTKEMPADRQAYPSASVIETSDELYRFLVSANFPFAENPQ